MEAVYSCVSNRIVRFKEMIIFQTQAQISDTIKFYHKTLIHLVLKIPVFKVSVSSATSVLNLLVLRHQIL